MQDLSEKSNVDYVYYNCILHNNNDNDLPCEFYESRPTPYLYNIEDYELAVIRFKICAFSLPLFTFEDGAYSIMMSYEHAVHGTITSDPHVVQFIPSIVNPSSRDVYDYNDFVNMVNIALHDTYADLRTKVWDADNITALEGVVSEPVIQYDPITKLFSIDIKLVQQNIYLPYWPGEINSEASIMQGKIKLIFNPKLYGFFNGFPSYRNANQNGYTIKLFDRNGVFRLDSPNYPLPARAANTIITNVASYPTLASFHKKNRFIITTTLPIVSENLGFNSDAVNRTNAILSDYELSPSQDTQSAKEYVYYFKQENYRWTNMAGNGNLYKMDWRIFNQGQENLLTNILKIPSGGEVYLKLMFRRRPRNTLLTQTINEDKNEKKAITSGGRCRIKY